MQRNTGTVGDIALRGTAPTGTVIEASFNGGAYATIGTADLSGLWSGTLTGQQPIRASLVVRNKNNTAVSTTITNVGVGNVYGLIGQSNMLGQQDNNHSYTGAIKASYCDASGVWNDLTIDPVAPGFGTGSAWPGTLSAVSDALNIPVGIVQTAQSGSTIAQWQPNGTYYNAAKVRFRAVGALKAVLMWQGESDAQNLVPQATYQTSLETLAAGIETDFSVKLMPAKFAHCSILTDPSQQAIWDAVANRWASSTHVLTGPDLSGIMVTGLHLHTDAENNAAVALWSPLLIALG